MHGDLKQEHTVRAVSCAEKYTRARKQSFYEALIFGVINHGCRLSVHGDVFCNRARRVSFHITPGFDRGVARCSISLLSVSVL